MNATLKQLLNNKNLGAIRFDNDFNIVEIDDIAAKILVSVGQSLSERNLLRVFPEFIGSELFIQNIFVVYRVSISTESLNI